MKAPFCRQGNKTVILDKILNVVPPHKTYCELFAGSAVLFFNLPKVETSVLNDLDYDVYNRLKLLQKAPLDKSKYKTGLNTIPALKEFYDEPHRSIPDKILYEKIKACNGYGAKPLGKSGDIYTAYDPYKITNNLEYYKDMLKGVKITNKDYAKIIEKYDSEDTFFFIDPPYENTAKVFYKDSNFDYERLADMLKSIKGNFLITVNDSKNIRHIFRNFLIKKIRVRSNWTDFNNHTSQYRGELFITNYRN
jgi:DNA adenine methylase